MKSWGALDPGTVIAGTYQIVKLLGRGGMGEVYEAVHGRTGASLAVKVLLADFSEQGEVLSRFKREAETTSRLRHPNIVKMFDFDSLPDGRPFLVMELLSGTDLSGLLRSRQRFPPKRVVAIIDQVALALAAAHGAGVVHRDLSPGNIFIEPLPGTDRDLVRVLDFGISKVRDARSALTQTTSVMGTPYYMSPEQAKGHTKETDARSDQFALGAITYELLVGRRAFAPDDSTDDDSAPAILYRAVHVDPPRFAALGVPLPEALESVVFKALSKDPRQRYPDVMTFSEALAEAARDVDAGGAGRGGGGRAGGPAPATGGQEPVSQTRHYPSAKIPASGTTTLGRATGELTEPRDDQATLKARRRRVPVAVIAAVAIGSVGLGAVAIAMLVRQGGGAADAEPAPAAAARMAAAEAATGGGVRNRPKQTEHGQGAEQKPPGEPGDDTDAREHGARPAAAATAPARAAAAEMIRVPVDDAPRGTTAWEAGKRLPLPLPFGSGSGVHQVTFKAAGYRDLTVAVAAREGERVSLKGIARNRPDRPSRPAPGARTSPEAPARDRSHSPPSNEDIY